MDLQKWIVLGVLSLHLCSLTIAEDKIDPNYEFHICGTSGNYTQGSTYHNNLNKLLSSLSNNVNEYGFYNGSVGQDPNRASAIVLCRGDVEQSTCRHCVSDNAQRIVQWCPNQKEAFRWYNVCSIYYSDEFVIGSLRTTPEVEQHSTISFDNPALFNQYLTSLVDRLKRKAANGGPFLKFAVDNSSAPEKQTLYAYMQCTPDLSAQNCTDCLTSAVALWNTSKGNGKIGARVLRPSCFFRYENSSFFDYSLIQNSPTSSPLSSPSPESSLPPPFTSPPPSPSSSPESSSPPPNSSAKDGNKIPTVIIIAAGLIVSAIM